MKQNTTFKLKCKNILHYLNNPPNISDLLMYRNSQKVTSIKVLNIFSITHRGLTLIDNLFLGFHILYFYFFTYFCTKHILRTKYSRKNLAV